MLSQNRLFIFLLCLAGFAGGAIAGNTDTGLGARAAAMGNVFVAVANDSYAPYYNPAGCAIIKNVNIGTTYGMYYTGLTDGSSIYEADLSVVVPSDEKSGLGFYWKETGLRDYYSEDVLAGAYAMQLSKSLVVGGALKLRSLGYANNDLTKFNKVLTALSVSALSMDLGALYNLAPGINAGLTLGDILSPNLGINTSNVVPLSIRAGLSWYPMSGPAKRDLLVALDGYTAGSDFAVAAGGEYWAMPKVACVRGGYSTGNNGMSTISGGLGVRMGRLVEGMNFQLDYSFELATSLAELGPTHRISINVVLDNPPKAAAAPAAETK